MNLFRKKQKEQTLAVPVVHVKNKGGDIKPKQKPRKVIHRICSVCLNQFTAQRRDAKYCSSACRQHAYIKGSDWGFSTNAAEHFLMKALQMFLTRVLENEGLPLHQQEIDTWIDQSVIVRAIFFNYLNDDNYYKLKYANELEAFQAQIKIKFSRTALKPNSYAIPAQLKNDWLRFLEALE